MLFCTPVELPEEFSKDGQLQKLDYRTVVENTSELCISNEASIGIGNEIFHTSYLSETFVISASSERIKYNKLCEWIMIILMFSQFDEERIISTAKNLLSELTEIKREGSEMLSAISTKIIAECNNDNGNTPLLNDLAISIFNQENFLKNILSQIEEGKTNEIIKNLEDIQKCLLKPLEVIAKEADDSHNSPIYMKKEIIPGFVQIGMPFDEDQDIIQEFLDIWDRCYGVYVAYNKRNQKDICTLDHDPHHHPINYNNLYTITSAFPFPRKPFNIQSIDEAHQSVMVPIAGLCTSYLIQFVESEVLSPIPNQDFYALIILTELLTRAEGPLYTSIRGNGYAYDGSLCLYLWSGQLAFSLYDSSEPQKATMEFYQTLEEMNTEEGWKNICSDFHIDTAKASVVYKNVSSKSTAAGVIYSYLRGALRGFIDSEEDALYNKYVQEVTSEDLRRVYNKYCRQFLDPSKRFTVMTTIIGDATEQIKEAFAHPEISAYSALDQEHPEKYAILFQESSMENLKIQGGGEEEEEEDVDKMSIYTQ